MPKEDDAKKIAEDAGKLTETLQSENEKQIRAIKALLKDADKLKDQDELQRQIKKMTETMDLIKQQNEALRRAQDQIIRSVR